VEAPFSPVAIIQVLWQVQVSNIARDPTAQSPRQVRINLKLSADILGIGIKEDASLFVPNFERCEVLAE
jgi:hypothetical protein